MKPQEIQVYLSTINTADVVVALYSNNIEHDILRNLIGIVPNKDRIFIRSIYNSSSLQSIIPNVLLIPESHIIPIALSERCDIFNTQVIEYYT